MSSAGHDILGRLYVLNITRPVTYSRKLRAFLGHHEKDTLLSGITKKPRWIRKESK